jgi:hypothetical protein
MAMKNMYVMFLVFLIIFFYVLNFFKNNSNGLNVIKLKWHYL